MTAVFSIGALDQRDRSLYLCVQNRLMITLRKSYPHHMLTGCRFVSEEEMDCVFPAEIDAMVEEEVAAKLSAEFDAEQHTADYLNDHAVGDRFANRVELAKDEETVAKLAEWVRDYILNGKEIAEERINAYCRNDAVRSLLPDVVAALTCENERSKALQEEYDRLRQRYHMFTAMGCYVKGVIYLCPERMAKAASSAMPLEELVEVVWTHEEMHSLLDSHLSREVEEHLAQSMTAAALQNCGKQKQLDIMIELARNQPRHYGLFNEGSNLESLLPEVRRRHQRLRLRKEKAPGRSTFVHFLPDVIKRVEAATGGRATKMGQGVLVTSNGRYLVGNVLDGKEDTARYDLVLDLELLGSTPLESTFVVLSKDCGSKTMAYVIPASWFVKGSARGAPDAKRMRGVMRLSLTLGEDKSSLTEFKDNYACLR